MEYVKVLEFIIGGAVTVGFFFILNKVTGGSLVNSIKKIFGKGSDDSTKGSGGAGGGSTGTKRVK